MKPSKHFGLFYFKAGCLLFWGCWFSLASMTNIFDFLQIFYKLPANWQFKSGNYLLLQKACSIYAVSDLFLNVLFICDITIQILSAILFLMAFPLFLFKHRLAYPIINSAFTISMALWAVFLIMEEIFIAYSYEAVHSNLFIFELLTLLSLHLLPGKEEERFCA